jgi:hypothetical protein
MEADVSGSSRRQERRARRRRKQPEGGELPPTTTLQKLAVARRPALEAHAWMCRSTRRQWRRLPKAAAGASSKGGELPPGTMLFPTIYGASQLAGCCTESLRELPPWTTPEVLILPSGSSPALPVSVAGQWRTYPLRAAIEYCPLRPNRGCACAASRLGFDGIGLKTRLL